MSRSAALLLILIVFVVACTQGPAQDRLDRARETADRLAESINSDFIPIRRQVVALAESVRNAYLRQDEILPTVDTGKYKHAPSGVMYKAVQDGRAALFVSGFTPITKQVIREAYFTEAIDQDLEKACRKFPAVVQSYYNTATNMNRIYPPFDVLTQFEPRINISGFNFYYLADREHNPKQGPVWVADPYVDPAGRGWIVSAIAPVYVDDVLKGVAGLDVTISTITDRFIAETDTNVMLVDSAGVVVTGHEDFISLFSLPPLTEHKYLTTIKQDTYRRADYSLLKSRSKAVRSMAGELLGRMSDQEGITIRGRNYTILSAGIPELGWTLLYLVE